MAQMATRRLMLGLLAAGGAALALPGCAVVAVGGAASATAAKATQERGLSGAMSDADIQLRINKLWFDNSLELYNRIHSHIDQGRVLLTGRAKDPDMRMDAVRLVWQVDGVKEVINEIGIDNDTGFVEDVQDSWIITKLRSALLFDSDIKSVNYTLESVKGIVYLMGVASSREELRKVVAHARAISGVRQVVNHVRLG